MPAAKRVVVRSHSSGQFRDGGWLDLKNVRIATGTGSVSVSGERFLASPEIKRQLGSLISARSAKVRGNKK